MVASHAASPLYSPSGLLTRCFLTCALRRLRNSHVSVVGPLHPMMNSRLRPCAAPQYFASTRKDLTNVYWDSRYSRTSLCVFGHLRSNDATFSTIMMLGRTAVISMTAKTPMPRRRSSGSCTVAASDAGWQSIDTKPMSTVPRSSMRASWTALSLISPQRMVAFGKTLRSVAAFSLQTSTITMFSSFAHPVALRPTNSPLTPHMTVTVLRSRRPRRKRFSKSVIRKSRSISFANGGMSFLCVVNSSISFPRCSFCGSAAALSRLSQMWISRYPPACTRAKAVARSRAMAAFEATVRALVSHSPLRTGLKTGARMDAVLCIHPSCSRPPLCHVAEIGSGSWLCLLLVKRYTCMTEGYPMASLPVTTPPSATIRTPSRGMLLVTGTRYRASIGLSAGRSR